MNTKISYLYRDADNYKRYNESSPESKREQFNNMRGRNKL